MHARSLRARRRPLAAELSVLLACCFGIADARAGSVAVSSCADDLSPGTLRVVVANAAASQTIDLHSQLPCSTITLDAGRGEIGSARDLVLVGPGDRSVTIQGSGSSRVFHAFDSGVTGGSITVQELTVMGGGGTTAGGCILASKAIVLDHATVSGCSINTTAQRASGAGLSAPAVTLRNGSRVLGNHAAPPYTGSKYLSFGGGVYASQSFICNDSTISGNSAMGGGGVAGYRAALSFTGCTIDSNSALRGGGVYAFEPGQLAFAQSTISGNYATGAGGIVSRGSVSMSMYNSTVASNRCVCTSTVGYAAGIETGSDVALFSSIVARNMKTDGTPADLITNGSLTGAANAIGSTNAAPLPGVITVSTDPLLAPLAYHGGLTRTMAPLPASPVLDAGANQDDFATDQRGSGFARNVAAAPDIGAYERQVADDEIFASGFD